MTRERTEILEEKRAVEAALSGIKNRQKAKQLEILKQKLFPREEFSALKQLSIESHQEGEHLRIRLAELVSELSESKSGRDNVSLLGEVVQLLIEIRDEIRCR